MSNISSSTSEHCRNLLNPTVTQYRFNCQIEEIAPSKFSASHQILFIELMSIARKTNIISFILGQHKLFLKKDCKITTGSSIICNKLKAQSYQVHLFPKRCRNTMRHQLVKNCKSKKYYKN